METSFLLMQFGEVARPAHCAANLIEADLWLLGKSVLQLTL